MKTALVFATGHGRTRRVVERLLPMLPVQPEVFQVTCGDFPRGLDQFELLIFVCPTYGLEEVQEEMEEFLVSWQPDLRGRFFAACELGNFYGYEDFTFGALRIISRRLQELGATEWCPPLSLDSFPRVAWTQLERWAAVLSARFPGGVLP